MAVVSERDRAERAMEWLARQVGGAVGAPPDELAYGEEYARIALDGARQQEDVDTIAYCGAMVEAFVAYRQFREAVLPLVPAFRPPVSA